MSETDNPPVIIRTTDGESIFPDPKVGNFFAIKSVPHIGEAVRVREKLYRIKDIEHILDHAQGHHLVLIVSGESK